MDSIATADGANIQSKPITTTVSSETAPHEYKQRRKNVIECSVCSNLTDGNHLGVGSCRACAAFFRRWVRDNRDDDCVRGNLGCPVADCMKCRYIRCLQVGMDRNQVKPTPIECRFKADLAQLMDDLVLGRQFEDVDPQNGFKVAAVNDESTSELLEWIRLNYRELIRRRIESERSLITRSIQGVEQVVCSYDEMDEIMRAAEPLIKHFALATFPEIYVLDPLEKEKLYKHYTLVFFYVESFHRSSILYDISDSKRSLTLLTCLDMQNLAPLYNHNPKMNDEKAKQIIATRCMTPRLMETIRSFKRLAFTEVEFSALVALILTTHDNSNFDEDVEVVCRPLRDQVIIELGKHFESHNDPGYGAARIGELLSFLTEFQIFVEEQKRDLFLLSLFSEGDEPGFLLSLVDNQ